MNHDTLSPRCGAVSKLVVSVDMTKLGKAKVESQANYWINSVSRNENTFVWMWVCVLEWVNMGVCESAFITCSSKILKCNEAMDISSLSSSFTHCLAAPCLLSSTHFCLWVSVLLSQNNRTLFEITRRAVWWLFVSPHSGTCVSLKIKFHLCTRLSTSHTHTLAPPSQAFFLHVIALSLFFYEPLLFSSDC